MLIFFYVIEMVNIYYIVKYNFCNSMLPSYPWEIA